MDEITSVAARRHYLRGVQLLQTGESSPAIKEFTAAISRQPNLIDAYRGRAQAYSAAGQHELAVTDLTHILANGQRIPDATIGGVLTERAAAYFAIGDMDLARADWTDALELAPDHGPALEGLDKLRVPGNVKNASVPRNVVDRQGDAHDDATEDTLDDDQDEELFELVSNSSDQYLVELRVRARAAYEDKDYAKARRLFERLTSRGRDLLDDWFRYGYSLFELGEWSRAVVAYTRAKRLNPKDGPTANNLGVSFDRTNDLRAAIGEYRAALAVNPSSELYNKNLNSATSRLLKSAERRWLAKEFEEAVQDYELLAEIRPADGNVWFLLGYCRQCLRFIPEAIVGYGKAFELGSLSQYLAAIPNAALPKIDLDDDWTESKEDLAAILATSSSKYTYELRGRADAAYTAEDFTRAADLYARVTARDENSALAWFRLGFSRHSVGNYTGARDAYLVANRLDSDPPTLNNLGLAYARLGDKELAISNISRAAALDPAGVKYRNNLRPYLPECLEAAHRHREAKEFEAAAKNYEVVSLGNPADGETWFHLGYCRHRIGDLDGAIGAYERAKELGAFLGFTLNNLGLAVTEWSRTELTSEGDQTALFEQAIEAEPALEPVVGTRILAPEDMVLYGTALGESAEPTMRATTYPGYLWARNQLVSHLATRKARNDTFALVPDTWIFKAIRIFTRSIEENSSSAPSFARRGITWVLVGEHAKAIKDFGRALALWPTYQLALRWRHLAYRAVEDWQAALQDLQALRAKDSDCFDWLARAEICIKLRRFNEAIRDLNACIDQGYKPEFAFTLRAAALTHMGWANAALADMRHAMALMEHRVRKEERERIRQRGPMERASDDDDDDWDQGEDAAEADEPEDEIASFINS